MSYELEFKFLSNFLQLHPFQRLWTVTSGGYSSGILRGSLGKIEEDKSSLLLCNYHCNTEECYMAF